PPGVPPAPRPLRPGEVPLLHFHHAQTDPHDAAAARDLGLALSEVGMNYPDLGRLVGPTALPLLEAASEADAGDVAAWQARGLVPRRWGRPAEGLGALSRALARASEREPALTYAAVLSAGLGRDDEAIGYWRRAVALNPWCSPYRYRLAKSLATRGDWTG